MGSPRVFYLTPANELACGGELVAHRHVVMLREAGIEAWILPVHDIRQAWLDAERAPEVSASTLKVDTRDWIVGTEVAPEQLLEYRRRFGCRLAVFVQNDLWFRQPAWLAGRRAGGLPGSRWLRWHLAERSRPSWFAKRGGIYRRLGIERVLVCGQHLHQIVTECGEEPALVLNYVPSIFRPDPAVRRDRRILFLLRKNDHAAQAARALALRRISFEAEFVSASPYAEMPARYQSADVFAATGFPEGLPLPPLEAMASGCAVVGYTGRGGNEYMIDGETCLTVPDGDLGALTGALERLLSDNALRSRIRAGGQRAAARYTRAESARQLLEAWRPALG